MGESLISRIQQPSFLGFVVLYGLCIGVVARVFKDLGTTLLPASRAGVIMLLEHVFAICTAAFLGGQIPGAFAITGAFIVIGSLYGVIKIKNQSPKEVIDRVAE
jgi:drug/metabolite transporter (DMT)-like permease